MISPPKSKVMAFVGQIPIRSEIVVDTTRQQINIFTYLEYKILCKEEKDIT
jgi:hypothetical protein